VFIWILLTGRLCSEETKNKGKLKLLSDKIIWTTDGADKPRLSYAYSDIKGKKNVILGGSLYIVELRLRD
jgi:hypothetical protein